MMRHPSLGLPGGRGDSTADAAGCLAIGVIGVVLIGALVAVFLWW